jgi:hypothetical protein
MTSIYQRAMGSDFDRLHPKIRERFGFSSADRVACIGRGVMDEIWHGRLYTLPFLYIGSWRRIMFPERGRQVPFSIENYAFLDPFGRETVTWIRRFETKTPRRFDAYMIYSESRARLIDYLGTHQHLAVDIDLSVDKTGGINLRSGAQRFYEGLLGFSFPLSFSGIADVRESYDDKAGKYHINVNVTNRLWGPLFGYRGTFEATWLRDVSEAPQAVRPFRYERRD